MIRDIARAARDAGGRALIVGGWVRDALRGDHDGVKDVDLEVFGIAEDRLPSLLAPFGRVEAVGSNVTEVRPRHYVVATVRRPGTSLYDLIGTNDMTTDDTYFERGINLRHGFLTEHYVEDADFKVVAAQETAREEAA